jgi:hypothetical protein
MTKRKLAKTINGNPTARHALVKWAGVSIITMTWPRLCDALLECDDVAMLNRWLMATVESGGSLYRALRIHGRLSAVRRTQELKVIHAACKPVKPIEIEAA